MEGRKEEGSMNMKKRIPMFIAMALLAAMVIISAVVPEPEEKHDVEYPMANAAISWEQTFYSGAWNE